LIAQLAGNDGERAECERGMAESAKRMQTAARALHDATERLRAAAEVRQWAGSAWKMLRERHGSPDAIEHVAAEWERARVAAIEAAPFRQEVARLEARAAELAASSESASEAVATAEADAESARTNYQQFVLRDRAAA